MIWYYVFVKYKFNIPFNHTIGTEDEITWFWKYYVVTHLRYIGLLSGIAVAYLNVFKPEQLKNAFQNNRVLLNLVLVISLIFVVFIFLFFAG